jgi:hypothetical protein
MDRIQCIGSSRQYFKKLYVNNNYNTYNFCDPVVNIKKNIYVNIAPAAWSIGIAIASRGTGCEFESLHGIHRMEFKK